jgi:hypothetical protein
MKITHLLILLTLLCISCKKTDDKATTTYNGFKIDDTIYQMDTLERDFSATTGALRIQSKTNSGGMVYLRTLAQSWPSTDGIYHYTVRDSPLDTTEVKICFEQDKLFETYCSMTGGVGISTMLTITISNGKWALSLPPTHVIGNTQRTLEISASE